MSNQQYTWRRESAYGRRNPWRLMPGDKPATIFGAKAHIFVHGRREYVAYYSAHVPTRKFTSLAAAKLWLEEQMGERHAN